MINFSTDDIGYLGAIWLTYFFMFGFAIWRDEKAIINGKVFKNFLISIGLTMAATCALGFVFLQDAWSTYAAFAFPIIIALTVLIFVMKKMSFSIWLALSFLSPSLYPAIVHMFQNGVASYFQTAWLGTISGVEIFTKLVYLEISFVIWFSQSELSDMQADVLAAASMSQTEMIGIVTQFGLWGIIIYTFSYIRKKRLNAHG
ncbi:MAG: hypothetical protein AAF549_02510 [Pseudomonadota bacterium]